MPASDIVKKIYRPSYQVGQVYAAPYSGGALVPIGNVLEMATEHSEEVERQNDMTKLGGGVHAEVRRVTEVNFSATLADLNVVNLARAVMGTVSPQDAGTVSGLSATVQRGALIPLDHIKPSALTLHKPGGTTAVADEEHAGVNPGDLVALAHASPSAVTVKVGATLVGATPVAAAGNYTVVSNGLQIDPAATDIPAASTLWVSYSYPSGILVAAAGNYELRPEGIWVLDDAPDLPDSTTITIGYSYADQVVIEHLTSKAAELRLRFAGLNEAEDGKPCIVDMWRVSQGVTAQLAQLQSGFSNLEVSGSLLMDPNKTGVGISRYMRTTLV